MKRNLHKNEIKDNQYRKNIVAYSEKKREAEAYEDWKATHGLRWINQRKRERMLEKRFTIPDADL